MILIIRIVHPVNTCFFLISVYSHYHHFHFDCDENNYWLKRVKSICSSNKLYDALSADDFFCIIYFQV